MSDSNSDSGLVLELAEEFLGRYRKGERPPLKEYVDRHPDRAAEIRDLFPAMAMMEKIAIADESLIDASTSRGVHPHGGLQQLGDYRVIRQVGSGGMGVVYEAEQVSLGRHVALKVLLQKLTDERQRRRFEREAKAAAKLHHTNIVPVFGVGEHDGQPYYVMQFIQGQALDQVLRELRRLQTGGQHTAAATDGPRSGSATNSAAVVARSLMTGDFSENPVSFEDSAAANSQASAMDTSTATSSSLTLLGQSGVGRHSQTGPKTYWQSVAQIGIQVADALEYAHKQGILHRDIKPSNLLLDARGTVWVTDFGLAKTEDQQDLTHTGDILGTLRYMPPEAFEGKNDVRSDVYSLGLSLYELLALKPAFDEKDRAKLVKRVTTEEPPSLRAVRPDVPRDLETIVAKAIDKDPVRRYATAAELQADLQRFVMDEPIQARRIHAMERARRWCRRNPLVAGLTAALVLVLLAGFALVTWKWREAEHQRDLARAQAEKSRRLLYVSDIKLAHQLSDGGSLQFVRELLDRQRPGPGQEDLRGFEWYYVDHLTRPSPSLLTIQGHTNKGHGIAYSADGRRLATAGEDHKVRVWDAETGEELLTFEYGGNVWGVAFSPNGRWIATSGQGSELKVWDAESGAQRFAIKLDRESNLSRVAYSPNGRWIAAGIGRALRVWDADTGREHLALQGYTAWIAAVAFSPNDRRIASADADGMVRIWELETGKEVLTLKGHRGLVWGLAYSRDGRIVATGAMDQTVRTWDADTGRELSSFSGHVNGVHSVAFSPDGRRLASAGKDRTVRIWDMNTGQEIDVFRSSDVIGQCAFTPNGSRIAATSWDGTVRIWNASAGDGVSRLDGHTDNLFIAAYSPDGRYLATSGKDRVIKIWNMMTRRELRALHGHEDWIFTLAFSPDGRRLASASFDKTVKVWDAESGHELLTFRRHKDKVKGVAFSPDGRSIASAGGAGQSGGDCSVRVWDVETGQERLRLEGHTTDVRWVAFSPDGRRIVSTGGAFDGTVRLWDAVTGRELLVLNTGSGQAGTAVFSPDGRSLAVTTEQGATVKVWDAVTGEERLTLRGHSGLVWGVSYSPDGRRIASGGTDKTIRIWDAATGQELLTLKGHAEAVTGLAFRPDGRQLASASHDRTVRLWDAPP